MSRRYFGSLVFIISFLGFCANLIAGSEIEKAIADRYGNDCNFVTLGARYERLLGSREDQYRLVSLSTGETFVVYLGDELHVLVPDAAGIKFLTNLFYESSYRAPRNGDELVEICGIINRLLLPKSGMLGDLRIQYLLETRKNQWSITDEELFVEFKSLFYLPYFRLLVDDTWEIHFLYYNEDGSLDKWTVKGLSEKIVIDAISVEPLLKAGSFELADFP